MASVDEAKKRKLDDVTSLSDMSPTIIKPKLEKIDPPLSPSPPRSKEILKRMISLLSKEQMEEILLESAWNHVSVADSIRSVVDKEPGSRKVFVRKLGFETVTETLKKLFSQYGEIEEGMVISDKSTGRSRGFGFVTFRHVDGCLSCLLEPSKIVDGRTVTVQLAASSPPTNSQSQAQAGEPSLRKIYVGNVPLNCSIEEIAEVFSEFGELEEPPIGFDKLTKRSKGYALILYKTVEASRKALAGPTKTLAGQQVYCKLASEGSKQRGQGSGGGGGGGGGSQNGQNSPVGQNVSGQIMGPGSLQNQSSGHGSGQGVDGRMALWSQGGGGGGEAGSMAFSPPMGGREGMTMVPGSHGSILGAPGVMVGGGGGGGVGGGGGGVGGGGSQMLSPSSPFMSSSSSQHHQQYISTTPQYTMPNSPTPPQGVQYVNVASSHLPPPPPQGPPPSLLGTPTSSLSGIQSQSQSQPQSQSQHQSQSQSQFQNLPPQPHGQPQISSLLQSQRTPGDSTSRQGQGSFLAGPPPPPSVPHPSQHFSSGHQLVKVNGPPLPSYQAPTPSSLPPHPSPTPSLPTSTPAPPPSHMLPQQHQSGGAPLPPFPPPNSNLQMSNHMPNQFPSQIPHPQPQMGFVPQPPSGMPPNTQNPGVGGGMGMGGGVGVVGGGEGGHPHNLQPGQYFVTGPYGGQNETGYWSQGAVQVGGEQMSLNGTSNSATSLLQLPVYARPN